MHLRHLQPNSTRMQRLLQLVKAQGIQNARVLEALAKVPREFFIPPALQAEAYEDNCLPIGEQQTISMPSVVARMTEALHLKGDEKVLEIGTGCGYQTAVLCRLAKRVYTIERFKSLSDSAVRRLAALGYTNFTALVGDGTLGWPAQAPFRAIIVTAAGPCVPQALLDQLALGGVLIIPVGVQEHDQSLLKITKQPDGVVTQENLGKVVFVPLVGQQGIPEKHIRG